MIPIQSRVAVILGVALACSVGMLAAAQDSGKGKDDTLDALLKDLSQPGDRAASGAEKPASSGKSAGSDSKGAPRTQDGSKKEAAGATSDNGKNGQARPAASGKSAASRQRAGSGSLAPKDRELDELLEKLGQTKDEPSREDQPRAPGGSDEPKEKTGPNKPPPAKLGDKDKEIDRRLEELTGRRRKRPQSDDERTGAVGEIIKEMRQVEERLGKPDTGEDTQSKQKQVVKHIDRVIEEARRSGAEAAGLRIRYVRRPGQQQGDQQGDQTGALARGAPPMKPAKPPSRHSDAGGKEVWGHLPPGLRQTMENSFKEVELGSKAELIRRYFLSISEGKLRREE
jgi:hypothetical protein